MRSNQFCKKMLAEVAEHSDLGIKNTLKLLQEMKNVVGSTEMRAIKEEISRLQGDGKHSKADKLLSILKSMPLYKRAMVFSGHTEVQNILAEQPDGSIKKNKDKQISFAEAPFCYQNVFATIAKANSKTTELSDLTTKFRQNMKVSKPLELDPATSQSTLEQWLNQTDTPDEFHK